MARHKIKGRFIAIEGGDGSGKATQAKLLLERLQAGGYAVMPVSFPQYGTPSARLVEQYLNGSFGAVGTQAPELVSLAYALDRFAAAAHIRTALADGQVVVADRYVASNLAHQAAGMDDARRRSDFYEELKQIEYDILGIPRPDLNIVLSVPASISQQNVDKKAARSYTTMKRDLHEADANHLELAKRNFEELCQLYPQEFARIDCMRDGTLEPIEVIRQQVWQVVQQRLGLQ
ncbi:thymidylate kinase [Candidatus Saccharibacteria bacterium]|nr:thymidylate kinase [Candidatus Saccharibacteria bacterium]